MGRESVAEGTLVCLTRINVYSKCQLLSGLEVVMTEAQGHPMLEKVSLTSSSSLLKPFRTPCNCSCTEVQIENCLTQLISSREREREREHHIPRNLFYFDRKISYFGVVGVPKKEVTQGLDSTYNMYIQPSFRARNPRKFDGGSAVHRRWGESCLSLG